MLKNKIITIFLGVFLLIIALYFITNDLIVEGIGRPGRGYGFGRGYGLGRGPFAPGSGIYTGGWHRFRYAPFYLHPSYYYRYPFWY